MNSLKEVTPSWRTMRSMSIDTWSRQLAHDHVERVVDDRLALGALPPGVERGIEPLAEVLDGEVDERGRAAVGGGDGAGLEVVGRRRAAERHVEVRVHVDAARHHEHAGRVDDGVGRAGSGRGRSGRSRPCRCRGRRRSGPTAVTIVPFLTRVVDIVALIRRQPSRRPTLCARSLPAPRIRPGSRPGRACGSATAPRRGRAAGRGSRRGRVQPRSACRSRKAR